MRCAAGAGAARAARCGTLRRSGRRRRAAPGGRPGRPRRGARLGAVPGAAAAARAAAARAKPTRQAAARPGEGGAQARGCRVLAESACEPGRGRAQAPAVAAAAPLQPAVEADAAALVSEAAKKALARAANAMRRVGWFSFWSQLTLSVVSAGILLFSAAFTSQARPGAQRAGARPRRRRARPRVSAQNGPGVALYLTLFGVVAGLVSTFWTFGYTRLARRLRGYSLGGARGALRRVRKRDVLATLERGCWINVLGMAATLLGLQATVGLLVAKTLTNATANPFLAGGVGSYNPVLALDVFLVQARGGPQFWHRAGRLVWHRAGYMCAEQAGWRPRRRAGLAM